MSILPIISASVLAAALVTLPGFEAARVATADEKIAEAAAVIVPMAAPEIPALPMAAREIAAVSYTAPTAEAGSDHEANAEATMRDRENRGKALAALVATLFLSAGDAPGLR